MWVGAKNLYFHTRSCLSTRTGFKLLPIFITDDRSTFCHTITYSVWEVDASHELFHFLVEGSTSYNHFIEVSTKSIHYLLAYNSLDLVAHNRNFQEEFHSWGFQFGKYILLDNLFDNKGNGDNNFRLDFGKGLQNNLRTWHTGEEEHLTSVAEFIEEFECKSVHVCHRKHGNYAITGFQYLA